MLKPIALALLASLMTAPAMAATKATDPYTPKPYVTIKHPAWSKDAVLYQLNTRQFTREGTFRAAEAQLPRLKALGVGIIWLMPINRSGSRIARARLAVPIRSRTIMA